MIGRGETSDEDDREGTTSRLTFGETRYSEDGRAVGTVHGMEEGGVFLSVRDGMESLSIEHTRSGHAFGAAELVWRCMTCGKMGTIDGGLSGRCPSCDAGREELMYWTED